MPDSPRVGSEMKCPFKFRLLQFEGGEECDAGCAWRMKVMDKRACAVAVLAENVDGAVNFRIENMEVEDVEP